MKRINTPTAENGRFVDGNRTIGRSATQFNAEWCNQVQEELWNAIKGLTGANPTGASEDELKRALLGFVAQFGAKSIELRKSSSGSSAVFKIIVEGDKISIDAEGSGVVTDNSHAQFTRGGMYFEKSSQEPARTYRVEIDTEGVSVTDTNPNGTFTAELKGGVLRLKRGNSGVEVSYDKVSTPNLFLTFDPRGRTSSGVDQFASMTDYENSGTGLPTEYFVKVNPGSQGYAGRDYYILDSASHNEGAVVLIRNVDDVYPIKLYRESDTERNFPLCEIPPKGTKCVIYHGQVATGSGTGVTYVWDVM